MFESIREVFGQGFSLNSKDLMALTAITKWKEIKRGEHIIRVGDLNYHAIVVLRGLLSHYIVDEEGVEKTLFFVPEKIGTGAMQTLTNNLPADENIIALEDSYLLMFDLRELEKLAENNISILKVLNQQYKKIIAKISEHIRFLTVLSPEERYFSFCQTYPNLEQRIKQKYLASYLGITPTSLSRLRARAAKDKKL